MRRRSSSRRLTKSSSATGSGTRRLGDLTPELEAEKRSWKHFSRIAPGALNAISAIAVKPYNWDKEEGLPARLDAIRAATWLFGDPESPLVELQLPKPEITLMPDGTIRILFGRQQKKWILLVLTGAVVKSIGLTRKGQHEATLTVPSREFNHNVAIEYDWLEEDGYDAEG